MTYRIRYHPLVSRDLEVIARWIVDNAGSEVANRRLTEIEEAIAALAQTPHKGTVRNEIAPGLRAIPAGKRAVIAFTVDDANEEVLVHVVSYSGADWISRSRARVL